MVIFDGISRFITLGFGAILFSIPHYKSGDYVPEPDLPKPYLMAFGLCRVPQPPCSKQSVESSHMALFVIGQILIGLGAAPLYSLTPAYIDENINPKWMPIAMFLWYTTIAVGPVAGMIAGGIFQQAYIDIDQVF